MIVLSRKEFEKERLRANLAAGVDLEDILRGQNAKAFYDKERDEIIVPEGASTGTKLHEMGHKVLGLTVEKGQTVGDEIHDELAAEIYSWEARGKPLTHRVAKDAVRMLCIGYGDPPRKAVYWTLHILRRDFPEVEILKGASGELERWARYQYKR